MILIVDDNPLFTTTMDKSLSVRGFRSEIVADGGEAVRRVLDHGQLYALALIDVDLKSETDGVDVVRAIRAIDDFSKSTVPVVLMSGFAVVEPAIVEELRIAGALHKPFLIADLVGTIERNSRWKPQRDPTTDVPLDDNEAIGDTD